MADLASSEAKEAGRELDEAWNAALNGGWTPEQAAVFAARCKALVTSAPRAPEGEGMPTREAEIRERLAEATPGPWEVHDYNRGDIARDPWLGVIRGAFEIIDERFQVGRVKYSALSSEQNVANARLIANAPDDLAHLLSVVDELRSLLDNQKEKECPSQS